MLVTVPTNPQLGGTATTANTAVTVPTKELTKRNATQLVMGRTDLMDLMLMFRFRRIPRLPREGTGVMGRIRSPMAGMRAMGLIR